MCKGVRNQQTLGRQRQVVNREFNMSHSLLGTKFLYQKMQGETITGSGSDSENRAMLTKSYPLAFHMSAAEEGWLSKQHVVKQILILESCITVPSRSFQRFPPKVQFLFFVVYNTQVRYTSLPTQTDQVCYEKCTRSRGRKLRQLKYVESVLGESDEPGPVPLRLRVMPCAQSTQLELG